ncbi:TetR family transcriptional regulator [Mycobacterium persicum]|uniref:HTH-type transcriptional regulator BetI n=1 Tax=Mycobacterium persicum TaxID=1487726 RepID=A0A8E2J0I5_9MYCO|nr:MULTISPECIES: TetR/AcrR family transcriptional regulator [Mycobacterium]KZS84668.1 transcriptional regulator [Mycobacterium persicum]ORB56621.1 TetR family transcriptional regulator [Mycobacterium persicum]ORB96845.1 TetR family transcriptional regulator [Mycobacterium persicum]ORC09012.1 TetR family transcriptional regulator [Mycobacterium persicum]ORC13211.1 TetR family transcriptional regulator [Mycobacterium kansasii]
MTEPASRIDGRALRYQHRRPQLLAAAAEYVLDHGIADLSLRPLAQALGVTHATVIRHFTSKEALLAEVVEHLRAELLTQIVRDGDLSAASTAELLRAFWRRLDDPKERRQFLLLAEIYGLALRDRSKYAGILESTSHAFITPIEDRLIREGFSPSRAPAVATALLAQIRGLQLDLAATEDHDRIDEAFTITLDALLTTHQNP